MSMVVDLVALAAASIAFVFCAVVAVEVAAAFAPRRSRPRAAGGPLAILIPAHDEESAIGETLASIAASKRPQDRVLVVADNCSDRTAAIARAAGAEVVERFDSERRGKGYALQFGVDHLRARPPFAVVIVDADCTVSAGAFSAVADVVAATGRPAQMLYLMRAPEGAPPSRRISAFAWLLINGVRMPGLDRLAGGSRLTGSGMTLPWPIAATVGLATSDIVEDVALYARLAGDGSAPILVEDAVVESRFAINEEGASIQRARWENGSLRIASTVAPKLLFRALSKCDAGMALMALDLAVPPTAVLLAMIVGATGMSVIALLLSGAAAPFLVSLSAAFLLGAAIVAAWAKFGQDSLPLRDLAAAGAYARSKIGIYFGAGRASAARWTRTTRDAADAGDKRKP